MPVWEMIRLMKENENRQFEDEQGYVYYCLFGTIYFTNEDGERVSYSVNINDRFSEIL